MFTEGSDLDLPSINPCKFNPDSKRFSEMATRWIGDINSGLTSSTREINSGPKKSTLGLAFLMTYNNSSFLYRKLIGTITPPHLATAYWITTHLMPLNANTATLSPFCTPRERSP